jgi:hypothetical protein
VRTGRVPREVDVAVGVDARAAAGAERVDRDRLLETAVHRVEAIVERTHDRRLDPEGEPIEDVIAIGRDLHTVPSQGRVTARAGDIERG